MVRAACPHGETERHRLERPRLIAGNFETLDLRRERNAVMPDGLSRAAAALSQKVPQALARSDQIDRTQHRLAVSKLQPWFIEPLALDALHRKRDCAAGTNGVEPELVASLRCTQHHVSVAHTAQRAQGEQAFILDANTAVNVLAADGAGHTACARF